MVSGKRVSSERHNRAEEVVEAALQIFHRKGYAGTSIQDVADRVGVLKGSLYYYIDSKEDLLVRIFEASDLQSRQIMDRVTALEAPAIERIRAFAEGWGLWYLENVERAGLYFNEWRHLTGEHLAEQLRRRRRYERFVVGLVEASQFEGDADAELDPRLVCFFILSAINGLPTWYRRRGADPAPLIAATYADMVVGVVRRRG